MFNFSVGLSLRLMMQTAPFVIFRMVVYFAIAVVYVLVTGVGAGIGFGVGTLGDSDFQASSTLWGGGIGFALTAAVLYFLREYTLYLVKAGHIAVMVEALDGRKLPKGQGQITYARAIVSSHFGQASVLFGIDQLVKGVLNAITGLLQGLMSIVPIPGGSSLMGFVRAYLRVAIGLLDEIILAHILRHRSENPWASAREALVLYGQNARPMLINAAWVTVFVYGLSLIVFVLMLAPAAAVVYLIPGAWSAGGFIFALLFAWAFKVALIEPFAIACLLQSYFKATDGQTPNPEWEARLESASNKFTQMGARAASWVGGKARSPGPPADAGQPL